METIQKRQKLHEYIDSADDEKVNALFLRLAQDNTVIKNKNANRFYEYLKGKGGKGFSVQ